MRDTNQNENMGDIGEMDSGDALVQEMLSALHSSPRPMREVLTDQFLQSIVDDLAEKRALSGQDKSPDSKVITSFDQEANSMNDGTGDEDYASD